jgi:acetoin utilization deacetylase AcuC-like enzyme
MRKTYLNSVLLSCSFAADNDHDQFPGKPVLRTVYISHPECLAHDTGEAHPENARRITAIEDRLLASGLFDVLRRREAPEVSWRQLLRVHSPEHLEAIAAALPERGYAKLDPDTVICPDSLQAALRAAGAAVLAVDEVVGGAADAAFCCVRPPGHHAERDRAMGFCLFNNIAVGVAHALAEYGLRRVAVVDFDVHQGNGTEQIFAADDRVLYCSAFQHPFYPFTPLLENTPNRVNVPLEATATGREFRAAVDAYWRPALLRFRPQVIFVSAGFDAHIDDDMSQLSLIDEDYLWLARQLVDLAATSGAFRLVSVLEGGYELNSLARCVEQYLRVLMDLD